MRIQPLRFIAALILAAIGAVSGLAQSSAGQAYAQHWLFASDFGQWTVRMQSSSIYAWTPSSQCYTSANGSAASFIAFAVSAPVAIIDPNSSTTSEVVTPSSVTLNSTTCSIAVAPVNTHYNSYLQSGTGGLQEAINSVSSTAPYKTLIWLDRNWYALAWAVPGATPTSILAALNGNANAVIVDTTQMPFAYYTYNGVGYSQSGSTAAFPNLKVSSYTQIAAPAAVSTASVTTSILTTSATGGTITSGAGTFRVAQTYVDASGGETLISVDTAGTSTIAIGSTTSTNSITVTSPPAATGAVGWRLYITAASGATQTEILYTPTCSSTSAIANQSTFVSGTVCPIGASGTVGAIVTGTATIPTTGTAYPRLAGASGSYPPFTALGTVAAAATGVLGNVNFPAGYLNVLGRSIEVCGNGYATTNSTAGTLTLSTTLASIPGVTTITPFTAVSGSTAASAQADPFDFCITYTTAATGTTGTLEAHGWVLYSLSGTAVGTPAVDIITTVSSTIDLTKQDQLSFTIKPTTTALTAAQLRQLTIYPSN